MILGNSLHKWHEAVKNLPHKDRFLQSSVDQKLRAWRGDKILGNEAAAVVLQRNDIRSARNATQVTAKALSNHFFASNISKLLPSHVCPSLSKSAVKGRSNSALGTILEAAVAEVGASPNGQAAIRELSEWIIHRCKAETS